MTTNMNSKWSSIKWYFLSRSSMLSKFEIACITVAAWCLMMIPVVLVALALES